MTKRQSENAAQQLRMALQVVLNNDARRALGVEYQTSTDSVKCTISCPLHFAYNIPIGTMRGDACDVLVIVKEIEKIFPTTRVVNAHVNHVAGVITFVVKELGKRASFIVVLRYV